MSSLGCFEKKKKKEKDFFFEGNIKMKFGGKYNSVNKGIKSEESCKIVGICYTYIHCFARILRHIGKKKKKKKKGIFLLIKLLPLKKWKYCTKKKYQYNK